MKKVVVADAAGLSARGAATQALRTGKRELNRKRMSRASKLFVATVLLPTLLAIFYDGFVASDVFTSEAKLILRSPQRQVPTGLGAILQSAGFSRAQDDTYTVNDFIRSRDALHSLDAELQLKRRFLDPHVDPLSRFAQPARPGARARQGESAIAGAGTALSFLAGRNRNRESKGHGWRSIVIGRLG